MPLFTQSPGGYFVAHNATIVGDVTIGEDALVGAGAVVTRDVAPREVVAGSPARPLPSRTGVAR